MFGNEVAGYLKSEIFRAIIGKQDDEQAFFNDEQGML